MGFGVRRRSVENPSFEGRAGGAPDYAEPILGWRLWHVVSDRGGLALRSLFFPLVWPRRQEVVADCLRERPRVFRHNEPCAAVPGARCECGIYAGDLETVAEYLSTRPTGDVLPVQRVIGLVSLWGSVIECERGWRASRAYPRALFVPTSSFGARARISPADAARGLEAYGVPVELVEVQRPYDVLGALGDLTHVGKEAMR